MQLWPVGHGFESEHDCEPDVVEPDVVPEVVPDPVVVDPLVVLPEVVEPDVVPEVEEVLQRPVELLHVPPPQELSPPMSEHLGLH